MLKTRNERNTSGFKVWNDKISGPGKTEVLIWVYTQNNLYTEVVGLPSMGSSEQTPKFSENVKKSSKKYVLLGQFTRFGKSFMPKTEKMSMCPDDLKNSLQGIDNDNESVIKPHGQWNLL